MAKSKSADQDDSSMSFEGAMASLEQVVRKLESGSLPLEQMLSEYAKAVEYVQVCHRQLEGARRRIAQLQSVDADGKAIDRTATDFHARVVQHECDHLDGILYPRRIRDLTRFGFTEALFPGQRLSED